MFNFEFVATSIISALIKELEIYGATFPFADKAMLETSLPVYYMCAHPRLCQKPEARGPEWAG